MSHCVNDGRQREEQGEQLLTVSKAARRLGVHQTTLRRWADRGIIGHVRLVTGERRFLASQIDRARQAMGYNDEFIKTQ